MHAMRPKRHKKLASLAFDCVHFLGCIVTLYLLIVTLKTYFSIPSIPDDAKWQDVDDNKFFVYSAYYDNRENKNIVRIIGMAKLDQIDSVFCRLTGGNASWIVKGETDVINEYDDLEYAACFIMCPIAGSTIPDSVSVVTDGQDGYKNLLRVIVTETNFQEIPSVGVCVPPLDTFDDSVNLVEFMELNEILKIQNVHFYSGSTSHNMKCILKTYEAKGRATVLSWNHSMSEKNVPNVKLAALNDCLYRNMNSFSHLAFLDLDEIIVPAREKTIPRLVETLEGIYNNNPFNIGSYDFQGGLFYLELPDDAGTNSSAEVYEKSMKTMLKTARRWKLMRLQNGSKCIIEPRKVVSVGKFIVKKFLPGHLGFVVGPKHGILNHYQHCGSAMQDNCRGSIEVTVDKTALRYKSELVAAVKKSWKTLQNQCGVGDIHDEYQRAAKPSIRAHKVNTKNPTSPGTTV